MSIELQGKNDTTLLLFLRSALGDWRPKTIKDRLQKGCVLVNGQVITHHAFLLSENDQVEIHKSPQTPKTTVGPIRVLFQDTHLVGIDKPVGLLSVGTDRERSKHALAMVRHMLGAKERLWPVHRLDRETSGVLLFARSRDVREAIQSKWQEVQKIYFAVVEGRLIPEEGLIDAPLYEDKNLMVKVREHQEAKEARTHYWTRKTGPKRSLMEVHLETGRRHQIRVHMAYKGAPVVGDDRYGKKDARMALHAHRLSFRHPISNEDMALESDVPSIFQKILMK